MNRIPSIDPSTATGKAKQLLDAVQSKLGITPNLTRVLAHAPAALEAYLNLSGALASGALNPKIREQIALSVAENNACGYCLSAHTFIGGKVGLTESEITDARRSTASNTKTNAILKLSSDVITRRGEVTDAELESARTAGLTDADIVETVANVALNIFTNYLNHVAQTVIDFPEIQPGKLEREACTTEGCGCGN